MSSKKVRLVSLFGMSTILACSFALTRNADASDRQANEQLPTPNLNGDFASLSTADGVALAVQLCGKAFAGSALHTVYGTRAVAGQFDLESVGPMAVRVAAPPASGPFALCFGETSDPDPIRAAYAITDSGTRLLMRGPRRDIQIARPAGKDPSLGQRVVRRAYLTVPATVPETKAAVAPKATVPDERSKTEALLPAFPPFDSQEDLGVSVETPSVSGEGALLPPRTGPAPVRPTVPANIGTGAR